VDVSSEATAYHTAGPETAVISLIGNHPADYPEAASESLVSDFVGWVSAAQSSGI
jgi:hypothetical protein